MFATYSKHSNMTTDIKGQRHDRTALILYGSETGNSQDAAEELGRMAERLHFVTRVSEMDLIELVRLLISRYRVIPTLIRNPIRTDYGATLLSFS